MQKQLREIEKFSDMDQMFRTGRKRSGTLGSKHSSESTSGVLCPHPRPVAVDPFKVLGAVVFFVGWATVFCASFLSLITDSFDGLLHFDRMTKLHPRHHPWHLPLRCTPTAAHRTEKTTGLTLIQACAFSPRQHNLENPKNRKFSVCSLQRHPPTTLSKSFPVKKDNRMDGGVRTSTGVFATQRSATETVDRRPDELRGNACPELVSANCLQEFLLCWMFLKCSVLRSRLVLPIGYSDSVSTPCCRVCSRPCVWSARYI